MRFSYIALVAFVSLLFVLVSTAPARSGKNRDSKQLKQLRYEVEAQRRAVKKYTGSRYMEDPVLFLPYGDGGRNLTEEQKHISPGIHRLDASVYGRHPSLYELFHTFLRQLQDASLDEWFPRREDRTGQQLLHAKLEQQGFYLAYDIQKRSSGERYVAGFAIFRLNPAGLPEVITKKTLGNPKQKAATAHRLHRFVKALGRDHINGDPISPGIHHFGLSHFVRNQPELVAMVRDYTRRRLDEEGDETLVGPEGIWEGWFPQTPDERSLELVRNYRKQGRQLVYNVERGPDGKPRITGLAVFQIEPPRDGLSSERFLRIWLVGNTPGTSAGTHIMKAIEDFAIGRGVRRILYQLSPLTPRHDEQFPSQNGFTPMLRGEGWYHKLLGDRTGPHALYAFDMATQAVGKAVGGDELKQLYARAVDGNRLDETFLVVGPNVRTILSLRALFQQFMLEDNELIVRDRRQGRQRPLGFRIPVAKRLRSPRTGLVVLNRWGEEVGEWTLESLIDKVAGASASERRRLLSLPDHAHFRIYRDGKLIEVLGLGRLIDKYQVEHSEVIERLAGSDTVTTRIPQNHHTALLDHVGDKQELTRADWVDLHDANGQKILAFVSAGDEFAVWRTTTLERPLIFRIDLRPMEPWRVEAKARGDELYAKLGFYDFFGHFRAGKHNAFVTEFKSNTRLVHPYPSGFGVLPADDAVLLDYLPPEVQRLIDRWNTNLSDLIGLRKHHWDYQVLYSVEKGGQWSITPIDPPELSLEAYVHAMQGVFRNPLLHLTTKSK